MKWIFIILVCLLVIGCSEEVVVEEESVEKPKPMPLGIGIIEKTVHTSIISAKPENIFVVLNIEIGNIGDEAVNISKSDISLIDGKGNKYLLHGATSIYSEEEFPFDIIEPNERAEGKLVFDVLDAYEEFTLIVKDKKVRFS